MRKLVIIVAACAGVLFAARALWATTWAEVEIQCPICKTQVKVMEPMSFGSYIYQWPSRMQLLFWPTTDTSSLHYCFKCHYSAFMGDFETFPTEKAGLLRTKLGKLKAPKAEPGVHKTAGVPLGFWFDAAELRYRLLDKNDSFWSLFYRVKGYHLSTTGDEEGAKKARQKALGIVEQLLVLTKSSLKKKELLVTRAAMLYLTGKSDDVFKVLKEATAIQLQAEDGLKEDKVKNAQEYMDAVIKQLEGHVEKGEKLPQ